MYGSTGIVSAKQYYGAGGSSGQIQFNNGTAIEGASYFNYDPTNIRVGIGTSVPTARLSVSSPTSGNSLLLVNDNLSDGSLFRVSNSAGNLLVDVDSGGTILFPTAGNVGIGTTLSTPTTKLHVDGDVTASFYYGDGRNLTNIPITINANNTNRVQYLTYAIGTGSTSGLGVTTSGLVFNPSTTRLGIGTTNPISTLHVQGNVRISADSAVGLGTTSSASPSLTFIGLATQFNYAGVGNSNAVEIKSYARDNGTLSFNGYGNQILTLNDNFDTDVFAVYNYTQKSYSYLASGLYSAADFVEQAFRIDRSGNTIVGMGTVIGAKLDVRGGTILGIAHTAPSLGISTSTLGVFPHTINGDTTIFGQIRPRQPFSNLSIASTSNHVVMSPTVGDTGSLSFFVGTSSTTRIPDQILSLSNNVVGSLFRVNDPNVGFSSATNLSIGQTITAIFEVNSNGNVGVGTSVPTSKLHVQGNTLITGISTFQSTTLIGGGTSTGTAGQVFQVTGISSGAYIGGNLGIGTTNPSQPLHIQGNVRINGALYDSNNSTGSSSQVLQSVGTGISWVTFSGGGGGTVSISTNTTNQAQYLTYVTTTGTATTFGVTTSGLVFNPGTNSLGIGTTNPTYNLHVNGSLGATTKSFIINHPTKEGKKLQYGSLESPYHGIRLTGSSTIKTGKCIVELPDYIHNLVKTEDINIHITNIKHGKVLWVDEVDVANNRFIIMTEETSGEYDFYWDFTAIRKDIEDMIVEF